MTSENVHAPIRVAFILDNRVVDIISTDERLAAIFLSQPLVINVTDIPQGPETGFFVNSTYNPETGTFTAPVYDEQGNLVG